MEEAQQRQIVVPSRLAIHVRYGYTPDRSRAIWRWYWLRSEYRRHVRHTLLSPMISFVIAMLLAYPTRGSGGAVVIGIGIAGAGTVLGIRHMQLSGLRRLAMLRLESRDSIRWDRIKEHIRAFDDDDDDLHMEEIDIVLEESDLL